MTQTAPTVSERPARARPLSTRTRAVELAVRERWFELGVALCMLAAGAFAAIQRSAWPPHEDETLALFVGRDSLHDVLRTVLGERGGAPLHFLVAWGVAHLGGGLGSLRLVSALVAALSVPVIALLVARLADSVEGGAPPARLVAVVGGSGGAGASTLSAALAVTALRLGVRPWLVDADPLGGGIDLALGGEDTVGLR